jgi:hypothetical protein
MKPLTLSETMDDEWAELGRRVAQEYQEEIAREVDEAMRDNADWDGDE